MALRNCPAPFRRAIGLSLLWLLHIQPERFERKGKP